MSAQNPPQLPSPQAHSVRCEKHGLRYNPDIHDGCARCRRERGELSPAAPHAAAGPAPAPAEDAASGGSMAAAVAVALALIFGSGALLFLEDLRSWHRIQELKESGRYIEGLTPEQHEQLEVLQEQMQKVFDEMKEDGEGEDE